MGDLTTDLDHLYALAEGATAGPWRVSVGHSIKSYAPGHWAVATADPCRLRDANAAYIAALSPDVVKGLIERVRAAEARPDTPARPDREAVARIIDPEAYDEVHADDNEDGAAIFAEAWEEALAVADAILALMDSALPAPPAAVGDE